MVGSSMFVFDANPHAVHKITSGEEALVCTLFANFDTTWGHPALQDRLRRAGQQPSSQLILNGMTLFGAIWTASRLPEYQSYKVVWHAMRAHLENEGVLAAVVSRFNAYVVRKGDSAHLDRLSKSKPQRNTYPKIPSRMRSTMSTDSEDVGCQKRGARPSNLSPENPRSFNRVLSTLSICDCPPSPPVHASSSSKPLFSHSHIPQLGPSEWTACYEDEKINPNTHSSSDPHPHPFPSSCFDPALAQAQTHISQRSGHGIAAVPNATSFFYHTHGVAYEQEHLQSPEQHLHSYPASLASPPFSPETYPETQQPLREFRASMPSILTSHNPHKHEAQPNSNFTTGHTYWQTTTVPPPYLPYHNQSPTTFSSNSTVSENTVNNYWRAYTDGKFADEYASDAYKLQHE
ncbi:hypothetical protein EV368DRAFT_63399 [Lentinula lateritia]|uniref:Uncharacterized protein n=1 Tax=Lentinula aff. lateritia TaxID=2804960 RepID=A0ACC1TT57_9AGAR|nr:hypothetical protein F5876DRAFT_67693 [Lentinula aff. lateritia]KAJ3854284.1 hypothetical protein EV368DRAFT_63399 [Lentinula lateritia]